MFKKRLWAVLGSCVVFGCSPSETPGPVEPDLVTTPSGEVVPEDKPTFTGGVTAPASGVPGYPEGAPPSYPRPDENEATAPAATPKDEAKTGEPAKTGSDTPEVIPEPDAPSGVDPDASKSKDTPPEETPPKS